MPFGIRAIAALHTKTRGLPLASSIRKSVPWAFLKARGLPHRREGRQARPGLCPGPAKGRGPLENGVFLSRQPPSNDFQFDWESPGVIRKSLDFEGSVFDGVEGRSCPRFQLAGFGQLEWQRRGGALVFLILTQTG